MIPYYRNTPRSIAYLLGFYPMTGFLLMAVSGILAGMAGATSAVAVAVIGGAVVAGILFFTLFRSRREWTLFLTVYPVFFALGLFSWIAHSPPDSIPGGDEAHALVYGRVEEQTLLTSGERLTVSVDGFCDSTATHHIATRPFKAMVYTEVQGIEPGDIVVWRNGLEGVDEQPNQSRRSAAFFRSQGISALQSLSGERPIVAGHRNSPALTARKWRLRIAGMIENSGVKPATASLAKALFLGERSGLDPEIKEEFSDAGTVHILALSGQHLSFITLILITLSWPLALFFPPRWRFWIVIPFLWCYVFLTGWGIPVVRAALMTSFMLAGISLLRGPRPINALCLSALLLLLFDAHALVDPGFQLSFVCSAAICALLRIWSHHLNMAKRNEIGERGKIPKIIINAFYKLLMLCMIPVICFLASWVIVLFHFGSLPAMFLPANLLEAPLLSLFFIIGAFVLPLDFLGLHIGFLNSLLDLIAQCQMAVPGLFAGYNWGNLFAAPHALVVIGYLVAFFLMIFSMRTQRAVPGRTGGIVIALTLAGALFLPVHTEPDRLEIFASESGAPRIRAVAGGKERIVHLSRLRLEGVRAAGKEVVVAGRFAGDFLPDSAAKSMRCDVLMVDHRCDAEPDLLLKLFHPATVVWIAGGSLAKEENDGEFGRLCGERGIAFTRLSLKPVVIR